jgi:hypothetical protein
MSGTTSRKPSPGGYRVGGALSNQDSGVETKQGTKRMEKPCPHTSVSGKPERQGSPNPPANITFSLIFITIWRFRSFWDSSSICVSVSTKNTDIFKYTYLKLSRERWVHFMGPTQLVQFSQTKWTHFFWGNSGREFFLPPTQMGANMVQPPGFESWWKAL